MPHKVVLIDGRKAPSTTTVLSILRKIDLKTKRAFLELWRGKWGNARCNWKMRASGKIGELYHAGVNLMVQGAPVQSATRRLNQMWDQTRRWFDSAGFKPEVLEFDVRSRTLFTGGSTDGVGYFQNVKELTDLGYISDQLVLADWKTSGAIDESMLLQVTLYAIDYEEQQGIPIKWGLILRQGKDRPIGPPQIYAFEITTELRERAISVVQLFHWTYKKQEELAQKFPWKE